MDAIRFLFRGIRYIERRLYPEPSVPLSTLWSLQKLRERSIQIRSVFDVGASDGRWTRLCKKVFPEAEYFLIEAQGGAHEEKLREYVRKEEGVRYKICAASDEDGQIWFDASDPFGGQASKIKSQKHSKSLSAYRIDTLASEYGLLGPFLIKLDTHGFEKAIIEGASGVLEETEVFIIEAYNFYLMEGAMTFWELCTYMARLGFRPVDILEPGWRPKDQVFWQMDIVFQKSSNPCFASNQYNI